MHQTDDMDCETLTPYLLGELSDDEAEAFRKHLETCDKCRLEVQDLMDISNDLIAARDDEPVNLPSDLKSRTLQRAFAARPPKKPVRAPRSRFPRSRVWMLMTTAAVFLVGIVLGRITVAPPTVVPPASSSQTSRAGQIAAAPAQMVGEMRLLPIGAAPASGMAMVYQQKHDLHLVVYVQHMQPLSTYGCYSVWGTVDGHRRNLGDFTVNKSGDAVISIQAGNLSATKSITITWEPAWNDVKPRGPLVLAPSSKQA